MLKKTEFILFAVVALIVSQCQADLITNGSFENPDVASTGYHDVDVDDWVITEPTAGQVQIFDRADLDRILIATD